MDWIWLIVVGGLVGVLTVLLFSSGEDRAYGRGFFAGVLGAWLGDCFIEIGPQIKGIYLASSILSALVLALFVTLVSRYNK